MKKFWVTDGGLLSHGARRELRSGNMLRELTRLSSLSFLAGETVSHPNSRNTLTSQPAQHADATHSLSPRCSVNYVGINGWLEWPAC